MRLVRLDVHLLRLLDNALHGQLGDALADVVRHGTEPELTAVRNQNARGPSTWVLHVTGEGAERAFEIDPCDRIALAIVVHLHVADMVDDVRRDVAKNFEPGEIEDGLGALAPWPLRQGSGEAS